jgi:hypothetical protein
VTEPSVGAEARPSGWLRAAQLPAPVMRVAAVVSLALLLPLAAAYALAGTTASLGVVLGYTAALPLARMLPVRWAVPLVLPAAMTGAVAVSLTGDAFVAACFAALACLLVAPANTWANGVMAGLPTVAAVLTSMPARHDPVAMAGWILAGGVIAILVVSRVRGEPEEVQRLDAWTAWLHAVAMAVSVAMVVGVLNVVDLPHGYWIAATLTLVLRPFRGETHTSARQRVLGTVAGAVLGLALALLLPGWAALLVATAMLVLVIGNALLDRATQQVLYLTPLIVLLGSGQASVLGTALERVAMTLVGAVFAAIVGLAISRAHRDHERAAAQLA